MSDTLLDDLHIDHAGPFDCKLRAIDSVGYGPLVSLEVNTEDIELMPRDAAELHEWLTQWLKLHPAPTGATP